MKYHTDWKVIEVQTNYVKLKHKTGLTVSIDKLSNADLENKDLLRNRIKDVLKRAEDSRLVNEALSLAQNVIDFREPWWRRFTKLFK